MQDITDKEAYNTHLKSNSPLVVTVGAKWCGPCRKLKPLLHALAPTHPNVKFLYVDSDLNQDISNSLEIRSLPTTFIIYKKHRLCPSIKGADLSAIQKVLLNLGEAQLKIDTKLMDF